MRVQAVRWKIARRHLNQRPRTHRLRWSFLAAFLVLLLTSGIGVGAALLFAERLPSASGFHLRFSFQDARIFDSHGQLLYRLADLGQQKGGRREVEPLQARYDRGSACRGGVDRIPVILQNASIATEDATFYKNPGFDPLSIVRAAVQNLQYGHIVSGASTITQQLVRNSMLNPKERTLNRKAEEVALAYEVSKRYSKRKILWYYLNSVPYGDLAYGAQAASRVYFHTDVCRLDTAQAAMLAGLPEAPTLYNPTQHRSVALIRMHTVLSLMRKHGYLHSRVQVRAALREANRWQFSRTGSAMRYPQFVRYAMAQLGRMPRLRKQLYKGIDIYTTLDSRLQDLAQRTVTRQINALTIQNQHVTDGALVSLDLRPRHYGWILAMVGSAHYRGQAGQINMAVSPRQPGSSMKPFNYIWAFTHGDVGPATTVIDSPIRLPDPQDPQDQGVFQPLDYDRQFHGTVTLRQALANSLNVPAVKVEYYVTKPVHVAQTARRFGMTSLYKDNPGLDCSVCYAVTLGGLAKGTRLLEETAAYGVFATGGVTVPPVAIWKVVQRSTGKVLYCTEACPHAAHARTPKRRRVLDPAHAYLMTNILADNNARCTVQVCEFGLNSPLLLSRPAAAKTGTTNSFTDNWTVGYTPQIITGVWAGNADRSPMVSVIGITGAAPIWHDFMEGAFRTLRLPVQHFVQPPNVVQSASCTAPGTSYTQTHLSDLYVTGSPIPLCAIPDRGFMPAPCSAYQQNPTPLYPSQSTRPCEAYGPTGYSTTPQPYGAQYPTGTQYQQPTGQYQSGTQYQQPSTTYPSTGQPQ